MSVDTNLERLLRYCRNDGSIAEHLDIPIEEVRKARAKLRKAPRFRHSYELYLPPRHAGRDALGDGEMRSRRSKAEDANKRFLKAVRRAEARG